jgi:hypothetical protein
MFIRFALFVGLIAVVALAVPTDVSAQKPGRGQNRTPTPTAIQAPVATPIPTLSGGGSTCAHDPSTWHSLVAGCTYDHEHGDDPNVLDSLFGPLPQSIDYPWHAFNIDTGQPEGHKLFKWAVVQNAACVASNAQYSFSNLRMETHHGRAATTQRQHSYYLQATTCDPNNPLDTGTISVGGWQDFGRLDAGGVTVNLASQDALGPYPNDSLHRLHGSPAVARYDLTWYGANQFVRQASGQGFDCNVGVRSEDWGPVDPQNPYAAPVPYGPTANGSWHEPAHLIGFTIYPWSFPASAYQNGYVTYSGYTDRWGNLVSGCAGVGLDCVPIKLDHVKVGAYQFRADAHGLPEREYDVSPSPIRYPN